MRVAISYERFARESPVQQHRVGVTVHMLSFCNWAKKKGEQGSRPMSLRYITCPTKHTQRFYEWKRQGQSWEFARKRDISISHDSRPVSLSLHEDVVTLVRISPASWTGFPECKSMSKSGKHTNIPAESGACVLPMLVLFVPLHFALSFINSYVLEGTRTRTLKY